MIRGQTLLLALGKIREILLIRGQRKAHLVASALFFSPLLFMGEGGRGG